MLSKYGYLSIEMANSMAKDIESDSSVIAPNERKEEAIYAEEVISEENQKP